MEQSHNWLNAGLIILGLFSFILTTAFNALAGSGAGVPDVFYSTVGDISDLYELYITPAGFTFTIWTVIYLWLAISLVMFFVTIFLTNSRGRVYLNPPIASPSAMGTFSFNMLLNLAWIFVWDRSSRDSNLTIVSCVILFLTAATNILTMSFLARNMTEYREEMGRGSPAFKWGLAYTFVLNGLGIYTTWTVIASLVNLTTALVYPGQFDQTKSCLASLSLLVIFHCTWFCLENTVCDKYARYILTPYLVVIWASNGIRAKKMEDSQVPQEVKNYIVAILIIACITFVIRIALVIYREIRNPLLLKKMRTTPGEETTLKI